MLKPDLGDSRRCAIATQLQLEQKFAKNEKLREEYIKQISEAIELGHVEEVPYDSGRNYHYIPHHCVFKDSKTTALRVVRNASNKTSNPPFPFKNPKNPKSREFGKFLLKTQKF